MNEGIFLGLGSNMGDRLEALATAVRHLKAHGGLVRRLSQVYETPPWGNTDQAPFLNMVVEIGFAGEPEDLLVEMMKIEATMGRQRSAHWGPRVIDIDLLAFGSQIVLSQRLLVPHPMLSQRAFVLVPWAEIAPSAEVPGLGKTVGELLRALPEGEIATIRAIGNLEVHNGLNPVS